MGATRKNTHKKWTNHLYAANQIIIRSNPTSAECKQRHTLTNTWYMHKNRKIACIRLRKYLSIHNISRNFCVVIWVSYVLYSLVTNCTKKNHKEKRCFGLQKLFRTSFFNNSGSIMSSADIKLFSQDKTYGGLDEKG